MTPRRWVAVAVLALVALFGLMGGEYSVFDQRKLRHDAEVERDSVASLTRAVDSLGRALKAIETDPLVQERIAREQWGMVREGEFVFKVQREGGDSGPP